MEKSGFKTLTIPKVSAAQAHDAVASGQPAVICGCDFANAVAACSNPPELADMLGDQPTPVHVTTQTTMDFIAKNFVYKPDFNLEDNTVLAYCQRTILNRKNQIWIELYKLMLSNIHYTPTNQNDPEKCNEALHSEGIISNVDRLSTVGVLGHLELVNWYFAALALLDSPSMTILSIRKFYKVLLNNSTSILSSISPHLQTPTQTELYYLRSVGGTLENRHSARACIERDWPKLWTAIGSALPDFIPGDKLFSSILRVSSDGIVVWTHYDVMDNVLIQLAGRKRVVLWPPSQCNKLYLKGDKSLVTQIDADNSEVFPLFASATRYECILNPGDCVFIPALWFHNTTAMGFSVSINVFWKTLDNSLYDGKDLYGNKDPLPAQRAQAGIEKVMKNLDLLPPTYAQFYALRLSETLQSYGSSKVQRN